MLLAYIGGFMPRHQFRAIDREIFRTGARDQRSRWQTICEQTMLSFSDQQIITGHAILIAGYYDMMNNNLSLYHWNMVINLAWLSSAVHIASLTMLRDKLNDHGGLRSFRVTAMLTFLTLLLVAMWPVRAHYSSDYLEELRLPVRCFWTTDLSDLGGSWSVDADWVVSLVLLLGAYCWKLCQLFTGSRGWVRKWARAKPEAATERLLRRLAYRSHPHVLVQIAHRTITVFYIVFVAYAEIAESFMATIIYLSIALSWGALKIFYIRARVTQEVRNGETRMTFGQLIPVFLLVLPILAMFEMLIGSHARTRL